MGRKRKILRFSSGELEILSMLWHQGPVTLSEAHACFGEFGRPVGYTTMQTRLRKTVRRKSLPNPWA